MPILKQLVSSSSGSKRRSRADLTAEMISAPLGDFRHTMHVGRGGDAFGDTSFLSTRSGEPPRDSESQPSSPGPKPGLLSRTFRSSKRSQSVNRADKHESTVTSMRDSSFVKNAVSLPHLTNDDVERRSQVPKSLSSSPLKKLTETDNRPANGTATAEAAARALDLELNERSFGELMDLPPSMGRNGGGMKHAESIMSFHIDLGPSMLGDILGVMEKGWDEDDLGYEEGKGSEGRASPPSGSRLESNDDRDGGVMQQLLPQPIDAENHVSSHYTVQQRSRNYQHLDSCSISSCGSAVLEERAHGHHLQEGDTDSAKYSSPHGEDERDFSFMDEDDDEIRV